MDPFSRASTNFAKMMKSLGHDVHEYYTEAPQKNIGGWEVATWECSNEKAIQGITENPDGYICLIGGGYHQKIAATFHNIPAVEYTIGYANTFARYRVFESYSWMHYIYGKENRDDGNHYDAVIPLYSNHNEFQLVENKDDYLLYCGRLAHRKGVQVAVDLAKAVGCELKIIGQQIEEFEPPANVDYLGFVTNEERNKLMASAKALVSPTLYIEPFGQNVTEAALCGTPAITTDFGAFTETVIEGVTGYRCRTFGEFISAYERLDQLDPQTIRTSAVDRFSMDRVRFKYEAYFNQLETLKDKGWYDESSWPQHRRYEP